MTYEMALLDREIQGRTEGAESATVNNLRSIMETLNLSAEKAMDVLKLPAEVRAKYLERLKH